MESTTIHRPTDVGQAKDSFLKWANDQFRRFEEPLEARGRIPTSFETEIEDLKRTMIRTAEKSDGIAQALPMVKQIERRLIHELVRKPTFYEDSASVRRSYVSYLRKWDIEHG